MRDNPGGDLLMTPPIPGTAQPAARRRRSPADLFFGLLAVAVLTALTIGVPYALIRVFGLPVPHTMPRLSTLTHQLDVTTILKVLSVLVWLAWLQLVWCVIAEVRGGGTVRGQPGPGAAGQWHPGRGAPAGGRGPPAVRCHYRALARPGAPGIRARAGQCRPRAGSGRRVPGRQPGCAAATAGQPTTAGAPTRGGALPGTAAHSWAGARSWPGAHSWAGAQPWAGAHPWPGAQP